MKPVDRETLEEIERLAQVALTALLEAEKGLEAARTKVWKLWSQVEEELRGGRKMNKDLDPCPKCGTRRWLKEVCYDLDTIPAQRCYVIRCDKCKLEGWITGSHEAAVYEWNCGMAHGGY